MNPWDFGTGFTDPWQWGMGQNLPVAPAIDIPMMIGNGLANMGIRPQQFLENPQVVSQLAAPESPAPLGASLNGETWDATPVAVPGGNPLPLPQAGGAPSETGEGGTEVSSQSKEKTAAQKLTDTLRGVKAPEAPVAQKVSTPNAPRPTGTIKSGELMALLSLLGMTEAPKYQLPSTLGAALGGR